jgi:hypothetical protein
VPNPRKVTNICSSDHQISSNSRNKWWEIRSPSNLVPPGSHVHGEYRLPPGYVLKIVPYTAPVKFRNNEISEGSPSDTINDFFNSPADIATTYSFPKVLISLIQAIWAITALYRARGDQIEEYGYAAFGLTVAPYAWMSILNTVANLVTPEYPTLLLVRTPIMDEAEARGGFFRGELLVETDDGKVDQRDWTNETPSIWPIALLLSLIPLAIVGGISRFRAGKSTSIQRGFTMSWLIIGTFAGFIELDGRFSSTSRDRPLNSEFALEILPCSHVRKSFVGSCKEEVLYVLAARYPADDR